MAQSTNFKKNFMSFFRNSNFYFTKLMVLEAINGGLMELLMH